MIIGAHFLLYSEDAEADRRFFWDVLDWPFVDVGDGWLIFRLPPGEIAVHPAGGQFTPHHAGHRMAGAVLYLRCDAGDQEGTGATTCQCGRVQTAPWDVATTVRLPSGAEIGLCQPTHPTALRATRRRRPAAHRRGSKTARGHFAPER